MSADGEIDISVRAEGTDEAAAELAEAGDDTGGGSVGETNTEREIPETISGSTEDGGGMEADSETGSESSDDGGEMGGISEALSGGIIGGLVSQLLGPLLDVLNPVLDVLKAFLAPVAVLLLRTLAPVLREMLQLLPGWFDFVSDAPGILENIVNFIRNLPRLISNFLQDPLGTVKDGIVDTIQWLADQFSLGDLIDLTTDVLTKLGSILADLSTTVAKAIAEGIRRILPEANLPESATTPSERTEFGRGSRTRAGAGINNPVPGSSVDVTVSTDEAAVVEKLEEDGSVEYPG